MSDTGRRKGLLYSPLVLPIAVVQGFLFINGAYWWGADWPAAGVTTYLFLETIFLGWLGTRFVPRVTLQQGLFHWLAGFSVTAPTVYVLFTYGLSYDWPTIAHAQAAPAVVFTLFFVAPVEELIFRGILPRELEPLERVRLGGRRVPVLVFGTQVLFAVFHWSAYGGLGLAMLVAVILGCVWVVAARRLSLAFTMASHTAYNLLVMGVLSGGVLT